MNAFETYHRAETNPSQRRRIQAAVVNAYRPRVSAFVRKVVPPEHRVEGEEVGCIGVLVALEKYADPASHEVDAVFWDFAQGHIRDELRRWRAACAL